MATLHVFLDDTGTLGVGGTGDSEFLGVAMLWTLEPQILGRALLGLRMDLLKERVTLPRFHAQKDTKEAKRRVIERIRGTTGWRWHCVAIEKKTALLYPTGPGMYFLVVRTAMRFLLRQEHTETPTRILIVHDQTKNKHIRKAVHLAVSQVWKQKQPSAPFRLAFQDACGNPCLQAADYCAWVAGRHLENSRNSGTRFESLRHLLPAGDVFKFPTT